MLVITVLLSVALAIMSIIQAIYIYRHVDVEKQGHQYSWKDIMRGTHGLLQWTRMHNFEPEIVVTVAGSGAIIGNLFAKLLAPDRPPMFHLLLEKCADPWVPRLADHESVQGTNYNILIPKALFRSPKDKHIVIVDSTVQTGTILQILTTRLRNAGFQNIRTLCLVELSSSDRQFNPDYSYFKHSKDILYFPWDSQPSDVHKGRE